MSQFAPKPPLSLFALGFRPFFLLAPLAALVPVWLQAQGSGAASNVYYGNPLWHGHEMLFGYTGAVIAGFLLTAVGNWAGRATLTGRRLAALVLLWLYGRLLPLFAGDLPGALIAAVDWAFFPLLAVVIAVPLVRAGQRRHLVFVGLLAGLALANASIHAQLLGITETGAAAAMRLALGLVMLLIVVIAGRIVPFFTERALAGSRPTRSMTLDRWAVGSVALWVPLDLLVPDSTWAGLAALAAASANGVRLAGWFESRVLRVPLLWVLFAGCGWLVLGLLLHALAAFGMVAASIADHALTAGAIGVLTLGMMARVSLGHTGRPLQPAPAVVAGFVLINTSALVRVLLPLAVPAWYGQWLTLSALLWGVAFALFFYVYSPILTAPRADRRPG